MKKITYSILSIFLFTILLSVPVSASSATQEYYFSYPLENSNTQQLLKYNFSTFKFEVIIADTYKKFPELKKDGLSLSILAEPENGDFIVFRSISGDYEHQPHSKFYYFNKKTKKIKRMNINRLYTSAGGRLILSPDEKRALWIPVGKQGSARTLYMFDFAKDTRKTLVKLPMHETFDLSDGELLNYNYRIEWLDDETIGYTVFNQVKKQQIDNWTEDFLEQVTVKEGVLKIKK